MSKIDCEIIKDLIPNYVENLLSDKTKQAVDEHVKACKSCKEDLEILQEEKERQEREEKEKQEELEINHLKKYNKRLLISKIIAGTLLVVILITWGVFFTLNYGYTRKGKKIYNIIQQAISKYEELENEKNLEIIMEDISKIRDKPEDKQKRIIKGKDDIYSDEQIFNENTEIELSSKIYGFILEDKIKQIVFRDENTEPLVYVFNKSSSSIVEGICMNALSFGEADVFKCGTFELREEEYKGRSCYVIRERN